MSEWICLAKIVGAHGIKGEVKLKSFTSNPKDVCAYGKLSDKSQTKTFALKFVGFSKDLLRVKIEGINDRNAAETLVGTELFVHRSALPELGQDTYYHSDLIGLKVVELSSGDEVGTVSGIYNFGAGDILEISFNDLSQTEMIPFTNAYVSKIDFDGGRIFLCQTSMPFLKCEDQDDEG
ncbi:MAG: 16S rRNA processing protein RimM [Alphaproteobacteria bacterium]|nr:16S rRNA processing protein RimM [Alphaproteobacteria bacterium]